MRVLFPFLLVSIACVASLPVEKRQRRALRDILNSKVMYAGFYARSLRNGKGEFAEII